MDMWVEGVRIMDEWEQASTYIFRCGCTRAKLPLPAFARGAPDVQGREGAAHADLLPPLIGY